MSKSLGQIAGGIVGGVIGFIGGGGVLGAVKGFAIGSSIGGMIDPPPGPDLKGPTLEDRSFNSAAYGVSLATLHGTIAHTGSIIYLENNEYKAVAKKQKTGGKGGGSKGSYTTTTYFATFAVAIGEAMPGSKLRRIWAGGKLIYSVGESVDWETLMQSAATAGQRLWSPPGTEFPEDDVPKWHYYDGTQNEPDTRMEAVLGVGNCPSYEGTAYIIFYDFDLTEYGNGLQGCPIKVEVISGYSTDVDELPFQKVFESVSNYDAYVFDGTYWLENAVSVRALTPGSAMFFEKGLSDSGSVSTYHDFNEVTGWATSYTESYNGNITAAPGLTFNDDKNWHEFMPSAGALPNNNPGWDMVGWSFNGGQKLVFGSKFVGEFLVWDDEYVYGAAYGDGNFYFINNIHILKVSGAGEILLSRGTDFSTGSSYYRLWYDGGFLYRMERDGSNSLRLITYDRETLATISNRVFGYHRSEHAWALQFAVYADLVVLGWATRYGEAGGELHYEQWRIKNFNTVQPRSAGDIVGRIMAEAGIGPALRDLSELEGDVVDGYRITDVGSARGKLAPLQIAYLFDLVEYGFKIKAVKRGGAPIVTIPLSDLGARAAGDAPGVLVQRERETDSQLPSTYLLTYLDYNREYDTNTQPANYPSRTSNTRTQSLPVVLSATRAAQLADIYINLAWMERDSYSFSLPQKYFYLKPADVIEVEVAAGLYAVMRIGSLGYTADQRLEVSAKRAEPAVYQSNAVGSSAIPPSENIPLVSGAIAVIMDLPALSDETTGYGFGVAMRGSPTWGGGVLLRSVDNEQSYDAIQSFAANCTFARAINHLTAGDYFVIDRASELLLGTNSEAFTAITEAQMLTGKHYCAYGADGRWEIIQYANAEMVGVNSVRLSVFVRGLFGSEWAGGLHQPGDMLVLLDDPDNAFIGVDALAVGASRKFKAVTTGQDAQRVVGVDFIYRGVNLKPLSPVHVKGDLVAGVWTFRCSRRSRMSSNQWATGVVAPVGEVSLLFDYEIYEAGILKNTYQSTDEFIYSQAAQMADFGYLATSLTVKIFQISGAIGRGYPVEKSLSASGANYGNFVALLLHFNGANASTNFVDSSLYSHVFTAVGNARISTAQSQFGGASGEFYGGYIKCPDSAVFHFGAADFTIQFWTQPVSLATSGEICAHRTVGDNNNFYLIRVNAATGKMRVYAIVAGVVVTDVTSNVGVALSGNTHVAIVRKNGVCKIYVAGVNSDTVATNAAGAWPNVAADFIVGAGDNTGASYFSGFIDDLSVVNGVAIYAADFTPPPASFEDPV